MEIEGERHDGETEDRLEKIMEETDKGSQVDRLRVRTQPYSAKTKRLKFIKSKCQAHVICWKETVLTAPGCKKGNKVAVILDSCVAHAQGSGLTGNTVMLTLRNSSGKVLNPCLHYVIISL